MFSGKQGKLSAPPTTTSVEHIDKNILSKSAYEYNRVVVWKKLIHHKMDVKLYPTLFSKKHCTAVSYHTIVLANDHTKVSCANIKTTSIKLLV